MLLLRLAVVFVASSALALLGVPQATLPTPASFVHVAGILSWVAMTNSPASS